MKVPALQDLQTAIQMDPGSKNAFTMRFECIIFCGVSGEAKFDPETPKFDSPDLKVQDFIAPAAAHTPSQST